MSTRVGVHQSSGSIHVPIPIGFPMPAWRSSKLVLPCGTHRRMTKRTVSRTAGVSRPLCSPSRPSLTTRSFTSYSILRFHGAAFHYVKLLNSSAMQFHTVWRNWLRRLRPNQVGNSSPSTGKTTTAGARTTGLLHPSSRSMAAGSSTYSISTGDMQHSHTLRPSACEEFQSVVVHANCDDEPTGELEGIRKEGKE